MNERTNKQTNERMNERKNEQTNKRTNKELNVSTSPAIGAHLLLHPHCEFHPPGSPGACWKVFPGSGACSYASSSSWVGVWAGRLPGQSGAVPGQPPLLPPPPTRENLVIMII